ncbi:Rap1-interacting factor 1 protein [Rutstroemia sp. NJR-2017a BVV2]|nr:Rap1-interacting factor 1 protein [Rutstroemia sp. NJR-2017a BVV2]
MAMVEISSAPAKSINLETRPPTPPRESENSERQPVTAGYFRGFFASKASSPRQPATITPKSSAELSTPTTSRKKVGWSDLYNYDDPTTVSSNTDAPNEKSLQRLPPSADRVATKSILKAYHGPSLTRSTSDSSDLKDKKSISKPMILEPRMLESTTKQLAGTDRSSKLDAYVILSQALKACDNVPNKKALSDKMGLLLQFIRRDLNAKNDSGALDVQIAKEALILVSSFLEKKVVADMLDSEFNNFLVSYAIKTFEDPQMSKELVKLLMFILAQQNFPPKIMTAERVVRLISDLHKIEEYVKGKSIVEQRINIYRTLLRQSQPQMISETEWLKDLFSDMLSSYPNVRSPAILFGEEVAATLGTNSKVSGKFLELFKESDGSGQRYGTYYIDRLKKMVAKKPPAPVPQIWSVVILFLRARPRQLEQWTFAKPMLEVIQMCFNSSDKTTQLAANAAWNRMVYVIRPDEKTTPNMVATLSQPMIGQLQRRDVRRTSKSENEHRKSILSSICNLLYYALKPSAPWTQIEKYWDEYIMNIVGKQLIRSDSGNPGESVDKDLFDACSILRGLFDSSTPRPWNESRATSGNDITGPHGLECQVRPKDGEEDFFGSFGTLVTSSISGFGVIPFTERQLSMGQKDQFLVVTTPSQRSVKPLGRIESPLHHILLLLTTVSPGAQYGSRFVAMVVSILTPFFDARRLSKGKMDLVKDLLELLPTTGNIESCGPIWSLLAKIATQAINMRDETVTKNSIHTERPVGGEYRNIVKILEIGLALSPNEPLEAWDTLFGALVTSASTDAGDGGRALAVIEPVAKALVSKWLPNDRQAPCNMFYCQLLLSGARYPKDRQALDAARTILWGTSTAGPKIVAFDPYFHLYDYTSRCLEASYVNLSAINEAQASGMLVTLEALLKRCPQKLWINFLIQVQDGLSFWFCDQDAKITHGSVLLSNVISLWTTVSSLLAHTENEPSSILTDLEHLISSSLESKHASIANIAVEMWKTTFESTDQDPQYPINIRNALHKLASVVDIEIPHTSGNLEASSFPTHGQFLPSLDQQDELKTNSIPRFMHKGKKLVTESQTRNDRSRKSVGKSSPCVLITVPANQPRSKRSHETTPEPGKRKSRKKSSVGKLRHENSQIQFEAITGSSPVSDAMEESQHLTERQKEVRERQREEAAFMFPDIRSSPRPRSGTPSKASENSQPLPPHSSTKTRLLVSANAVRQTTPDLRVLDQDNFIASSPTPARKLSVSRGISGPLSSSPELASQRDSLSPLFEEEALDIPSSPPQPTTVQQNSRRLTTSFNSTSQNTPAPQAQGFPLTASEDFDATSFPNEVIDSFGGDQHNREISKPPTQVHIVGLDLGQTFSTYRSTPQEHADADMDTTIELTSTEEQTREAYLRSHFENERADRTISSPIAKSPILNDTPDLPSTPRRNLRNVSTQQVPNTPKDVFLDARSSPLSSDRAAGSDENFQDAVSSPRQVEVESQTPPVMPSASLPLSDLDESSLFRIVDQCEKDLSTTIVSTPVKTSKQNAADIDEESVGTGANSTQRRLAPNPKTTHASRQSKTQISRPNESCVSSGLSLIPETPAPLPLEKITRELGMEDADENLDHDLAVVVQAPDSWKLFNPTKSPNAGKKRNWTPIKTEDQDEAPLKKRKLTGIYRTGSEVSDSQDAPANLQSTAFATFQGNRRQRRGRSSNRSNDSRDASYLMSVEIDSPSLGQSITSSMAKAKLNRSKISEPVATPEPTTGPIGATPSSTRAERASRRRNRTAEIGASGVDTASVELGESSSAPILMQTSSIIASEQLLAANSISSAAVAQTRLDEDDGENPDTEADRSEFDIVEETLLQSQLAEEMEMEGGEDETVAAEMEASDLPTYQSMRAKLSSLVDDLGKASLTRSEISDMEDLFMEAKIKLFGTMRRM